MRIGTTISTTIHDECASVSASFARYSAIQSTGAETSVSRSLARKNVESAVTRLERSRMPAKESSATASILPASSGPISSTPLKYLSSR